MVRRKARSKEPTEIEEKELAEIEQYVKDINVLKERLKVAEIAGLGEYEEGTKPLRDRAGLDWYYWAPNKKAFLVIRGKTIEMRCDRKLSKVLKEDYDTVMESRYFGRGGIEIVPTGQLQDAELADLIRLSYNLTLLAKVKDKI